jgi:DNA polymerase-3 subunit epsilon
LATPLGANLRIETATYVVVDLETTGLRPGTARICEIGAVRVRALELAEEFQTLVDPRVPIGPEITALTGLRDAQLRRAPRAEEAVRRFLRFAGDSVLVAHNARFDLSFLDRETERLVGARLAAPVVDTVGLARRLLAGRGTSFGLSSLAHFFGTDATPCHRALPDAQATAEILIPLLGLAQERGAETVADLADLAAPRVRKVYAKRTLAFGAPTTPGVYLFRDRNDQVLYVGRARDLRARLRSYFRTEGQRPAVEGALAALERIEWRVAGSEFEAALEELRLIRELRPPGNARNVRPDRYVYLRRRGTALVCTPTPTRLGPLRSRTRARLACRALDGASDEELADPGLALPRLRARLRDLAECRRFEDAARLRDRIGALEQLVRQLHRIHRLERLNACILVPAQEPAYVRAYFLRDGRIVTTRSLPPGDGARIEIDAALGLLRKTQLTDEYLVGEELDSLLVIGTFLRRPPPELRVAPLDAEEILRRAAALSAVEAQARSPRSSRRAA